VDEISSDVFSLTTTGGFGRDCAAFAHGKKNVGKEKAAGG